MATGMKTGSTATKPPVKRPTTPTQKTPTKSTTPTSATTKKTGAGSTAPTAKKSSSGEFSPTGELNREKKEGDGGSSDVGSSLLKAYSEEPKAESEKKAEADKTKAEEPKVERDKTKADEPKVEAEKTKTAEPKAEAPSAEEQAKSDKETDLKGNTLDLTKPLSVKTVESALNFAANENGESSSLNFHLEGSARVNGAVNVGAWGDLGLQVAKSDTGATSLSFNYEAAVKAGLDLKFLELSGAVGVNGASKVRFESSTDAAAWLTKSLHNINQKADSNIFQIEGSDFKYKDPTVIKENGAFLQGNVKAKLGPMEIDAMARGQRTDQTFSVPGQGDYKGVETSLQAGITRKLKIGDSEYDVSYKYNRFTQTGDPVSDNNGTYENHKLGVELSLAQLKKMSPQQVRGFIAGLALVSGGEGLSAKAVEGMAANIDTILKAPPGKGFQEKIGFTWEQQNAVEGDKSNMQYQRMYLDMGLGYKASADLGFAEAQTSLGVRKSERIDEKIGSDTEGYAKQNFLRNPGEWSQFRTDNKAALEAMARKSTDPAVVSAIKEKGVDAGIDAMQDSWTQARAKEDRLAKTLDQHARTLANYGNQWVFSGSEEAEMLKLLKTYETRPGDLAALLDRMEGVGMSREKLMSKTGGYFSAHDEELQGYYDLAAMWKRLQERQTR